MNRLFAEWGDLQVRLDVWHFMRRFSTGCSTDAHPLYATFLRRLSAAIFEYDADDVQRLARATAAASDV